MTTLIIIIIWLALGIHSAFYLVHKYTKRNDFTNKQIPMLIFCILIPIVTHFATFVTFHEESESKILWKKKEK